MVGIIVTGHGNFATGLLSSLKLIAGEQKEVVAVDFLEGEGSNDIKSNIRKVLESFKFKEVLILADLAGGSPFNMASLLSQEVIEKDINVVSGANLPMLLEVALANSELNCNELLNIAKNSAIDGVKVFGEKKVTTVTEYEDGI